MELLGRCLDQARVEIKQRATQAHLAPQVINATLAAFDAIRSQAVAKAPPSQVAYSDTILALSPAACCAGSALMIRCAEAPSLSDPVLMPMPGRRWRPFAAPSVQVAGGEVVFALVVPEGARRGPVGFLKQAVQSQWIKYVKWLNRAIREYASQHAPPVDLAPRVRQSSMLEALMNAPLTPPIDHPAETVSNQFAGTRPEVEAFRVNDSGEVVIQPGQVVRLTWQVWNATNIRIIRPTRIDAPIIHESQAPVGEYTYTPLATDGIDQRLRLCATNACGEAILEVKVHLRLPTQVTVVGVEAVQSIQEYSFDDPSQCHLIPLLQRKRTIVRVYLDSGLPSDFNSGRLMEVSGALTIAGHRMLALEPSVATRDSRASRASLPLSVNFVIEPQWLQGDRLNAAIEIFPSDPHAMWSPVNASLDLPLHPPAKFNLRVIRVVDKDGRQPSNADVQASLDKLAAILPVDGIDGLNVKGQYILETDLDFNDPDSWWNVNPFSRDLFDLMEGQAQAIGDDNAIYCGIVAREACDHARGYGWPGGLDAVGGTSERIAYWRASLADDSNYIEAHEFGHACNLNENAQSHSGMGVDLSQASRPLLVVDADQMMDASSDARWVSAAEYLWIYYRDFWKVIHELDEHDLGGSIDVFSIGI
jgi:hypothetical protein